MKISDAEGKQFLLHSIFTGKSQIANQRQINKIPRQLPQNRITDLILDLILHKTLMSYLNLQESD